MICLPTITCHALQSQVRLLIDEVMGGDVHGGVYGPRMTAFIDRAMAVDDRKYTLHTQFGAELALCYIAMNEWDKARYHVGSSFGTIIECWASLHPLLTSARQAALQVSFLPFPPPATIA